MGNRNDVGERIVDRDGGGCGRGAAFCPIYDCNAADMAARDEVS